MNAAEERLDDNHCARLLAACDEALAQGEAIEERSLAGLPVEMHTRLHRALGCLQRLERAWPRTPGALALSASTDGAAGGSQARTTVALDRPPRQSPPGYEIVGELGRGGMGVVYKARQLSLNRFVALKMILAGSHAATRDLIRFHTEAESVARLQHPHIVQIHEVGIHDGLPFLALELIEGPSLDQQIAGRPQPPRQAAELIERLAQAVEHAHRRGVAHRDLKPANILLTADGTAKISDFGLAKQLEQTSSQTQPGALVGTPNYMAPEQAAGLVEATGPAVDVYALGAILYELLVGRPPFSGATALETAEQVKSHEAVPPRRLQPSVPRDLETICLKCLQKEPHKRYARAAALADDLRRWLTGETIAARPSGVAQRLWRWCRRQPAWAALIATVSSTLLAVSIGGPMAALWMRRQRDKAIDNETKAVAAEHERAEQLREAYLAQARAGRNGGQIGRRSTGLDVLAKAAAIRPSPDLRDEMIACLFFADLKLEKAVPADSPQHGNLTCDSRLARFAQSDPHGNVVVRRVADGAEERRLPGAGEPAWLLRFSPDDRWLAVRHHPLYKDYLSHTHLWNVGKPPDESAPLRLPGGAVSFYPGRARLEVGENGQPRRLERRLGDAGRVEQVAIGTADGNVTLYDLTGAEPPAFVFRGPPAHSMAFDPAGRRLALSTLERAEVQVHDLVTGATLILPQPNAARGLNWSDDGGRLAAAETDGRIVVWHVGQWDGSPRGAREPVDHLELAKAHQSSAITAAFNHAGDLLVSTSWDDTIRLWDAHGGRLLATAPGFVGEPLFTADDLRLAVRQDRTTLAVYEVVARRECREFAFPLGADGPWRSCEVSRDGQRLALLYDHSLRLYDLETFQESARLLQSFACVAFEPNGKHLLTDGPGGLTRWTIDEAVGRVRIGDPRPLSERSDILQLYTCRDGGMLLARLAGERFVALRGESWREETPLVDDQGNPSIANLQHNAVEVSPDGGWIATGTWHGGGTIVWDSRSGKPIKRLSGGDACAAFSPDGRWLVDGSENAYQFWDTQTWRQGSVVVPRDAASVPGPSAFSRDGQLLAIAQTPRELRIVAAATGNVAAVCSTTDARPIVEMRFSDNGSRLVVFRHPEVLQIWNLPLIQRRLRAAGLD